MASPELDALVIENLQDIEASYKHLAKVEVEVFRAIDRLVEKWAEEEDWESECNYLDNGLWLAPKVWSLETGGKEKSYKAKFWLDVGEGDSGESGLDAFYVTRLCQAGVGILGFGCYPDWKALGVKSSAWKKSASAHASELSSVGFTINADGVVFRQVKIESATLAKALQEQAIEDALDPFEIVLNQLKRAAPVIELILRSL